MESWIFAIAIVFLTYIVYTKTGEIKNLEKRVKNLENKIDSK